VCERETIGSALMESDQDRENGFLGARVVEKSFLKIMLGKQFPQLCHGNYFPHISEEIIFRNIY
jgi:hypothetical protein